MSCAYASSMIKSGFEGSLLSQNQRNLEGNASLFMMLDCFNHILPHIPIVFVCIYVVGEPYVEDISKYLCIP
jgi:hypothetical protein